jgi:hypothetical protein
MPRRVMIGKQNMIIRLTCTDVNPSFTSPASKILRLALRNGMLG